MCSRHSLLNHQALRVLPVLILSISAAPARADWRIEPSVAAGLEYDDNVVLLPVSGVDTSDTAYVLAALVDFINKTPTTETTFTPEVISRHYQDLTDLDSNDWFLRLNHTYTGQRSRFNLRGSYSDETARIAERSDVNFDITDPTDIPADNSGRVLATEKRKRFMLRPDWSYKASQRTRVVLGADFIDTSYDQSTLSLNSDYRQLTGRAGLEFASSQRNTVGVTGYFRRNEFAAVPDTISGYGGLLSFQRSTGEHSRVLVSAGVDSTEDEVGERQTNPVGEISYVSNLERSRVLVAYQRIVSGSGTSAIDVRDAVSVNLFHDVSQKLVVGAGIRAYQSTPLDKNTTTLDDRKYFEIRGLLRWRFTRTFAMDFDYRYTNLDRQSLPNNADSNRINLWLRYSPNAR